MWGLRALLPPIVVTLSKSISRTIRYTCPTPPEWEFVSKGSDRAGSDPAAKGWNVQTVLEVHRSKWDMFAQVVQSTGPLDATPAEARSARNFFHNLSMSFGYVLALAAHEKKVVSLLDWGGSLGYYFLLGKALLPGVRIDYHCKEVPVLCEYGQRLLPEATFFVDDACFDRTYDLVFASGSLQYVQDWKSTLCRLAAAAEEYLYVTHLPVTETAESFVAVQRRYSFDHTKERLGWVINLGEFLSCATDSEMELFREMFVSDKFLIHNAPQECDFRGFLFRRW